MEFKTSISKIGEEDVIIRGEKLTNLINKHSFSDAIFLLLLSRNPTPVESQLFASMLTCIIDHGMGTTSSLTSRFVMSGGNALNTAVGAGILAQGNYHGGAIENAMKQIKACIESGVSAQKFVEEHLRARKVMFGFGHKIYKQKDPRAQTLIALCKKLGYTSAHLDFAKDIEREIEQQKGRKICLNVDGVLASLLLEMGMDPAMGKGIFIIGRVPGLVAQATEERLKEKPVRRVAEKDITYE